MLRDETALVNGSNQKFIHQELQLHDEMVPIIGDLHTIYNSKQKLKRFCKANYNHLFNCAIFGIFQQKDMETAKILFKGQK